MMNGKGLSEYSWLIIARLLSRNYSVRTAFEYLRKTMPDDTGVQRICKHLENGGQLADVLSDNGFERKLRFYVRYLPLGQSIKVTAEELRIVRESRKKFVSGVSYQVILMICSMGVLLLFTKVVLPVMIRSLDTGYRKTASILLRFRIISLIQNGFLILAAGIGLSYRYVTITGKQELLWVFLHRHKRDGRLRVIVTCAMARKLKILLDNGVSILAALKIIRYGTRDPLVRLLAFHFDEKLEAGEDFEKSLDMDYFDPRFHSLCLLGLKGDDFPSALDDYIDMVEVTLNVTIKKVSLVFQGVCYLFVAVTVVLAYQVLLLPLEMLQQF